MAAVDDARKELEGILSNSEYTAYYNESKSWIVILWENIRKWLADLLERLVTVFAPSTGLAGAVTFIIAAIMFVLVLVVIVLAVQNGRRKRQFREPMPFQSADEMRWSYQRHVQEATQLEKQGQYTLSTRHLFLAVLLYFHEKEWLEARISKTNWEYYDELRRVNQRAADDFYHLALVFDQVTYGEHTIMKQEYESIWRDAMVWMDPNFAEQRDQHI